MTTAWRLWLVAIAGVALAATIAVPLIHWSALPDPLAVHWSLDGRPDGSLPKRTALVPALLLIAGSPLAALPGGGRAYAAGRAVRISPVTFSGALVSAVSTLIVFRNLGGSVWTDAGTLTPGDAALLGAVAIVLAAAAGLVAESAPRNPPHTPNRTRTSTRRRRAASCRSS